MKAVDINPKSAAAFYSLALSFYNLQQYDAGLLAANAVVTLNSGSAEAHLLHGTLLRLTGDLKNAEVSLRKAKSIEKENLPEIYWQLALLLNKTGRNKEAAEELEFYLKKAPDSEKKQVKELIAKLKSTGAPNK
jgi:tetratricopeptide (TPR) repeat protein